MEIRDWLKKCTRVFSRASSDVVATNAAYHLKKKNVRFDFLFVGVSFGKTPFSSSLALVKLGERHEWYELSPIYG